MASETIGQVLTLRKEIVHPRDNPDWPCDVRRAGAHRVRIRQTNRQFACGNVAPDGSQASFLQR